MLRRKWPRSSKVLLALAVVVGLVAFALLRGYVRRVEALRPVVGPPVPVVVAAVDLPRGTTLAEGMVTMQPVPSRFVPPGALKAADDAAGRVLQAAIAAGEVLTGTRLADRGAGPVAALVPAGLRAVVVAGDLPAGVVGAGDLVDVLATFGGGRTYTETVAEGLEVLRVVAGDGGSPLPATGEGGGSALVLLVSPADAERLAYARAFATISIAIAGVDGDDVSS